MTYAHTCDEFLYFPNKKDTEIIDENPLNKSILK